MISDWGMEMNSKPDKITGMPYVSNQYRIKPSAEDELLNMLMT